MMGHKYSLNIGPVKNALESEIHFECVIFIVILHRYMMRACILRKNLLQNRSNLVVQSISRSISHSINQSIQKSGQKSFKTSVISTRPINFEPSFQASNMSTSTKQSGSQSAAQSIAPDFIKFVNASPSHFHACQTLANQLESTGFVRLRESEDWASSIKANSGYFFTRNQTCLVAFMTPADYDQSNKQAINPFVILAAHTDSPVLKVKPVSKVTKSGYLEVGVECYGGGLWNTWFDRDLSVAGRVIIEQNKQFSTKLVSINRPILRIPSLAIHLNREIGEKGFQFNKQTHLVPILATAVKRSLNAGDNKEETEFQSNHHPALIEMLAKELSVEPASIVDFELSLYDCQPAVIAGAFNEFIYARALDNLMMSFISVQSMISAYKSRDSNTDGNKGCIRMIALFDNEEVGSESWQGAGSSLDSTLSRLHANPSTMHAALRQSLLVSADMAHALHPNYPEKHEENHAPAMHAGLVIKQNANQRYATSSLTALALRQVASENSIPLQKFVVRNDSACGSTIGPILSANTCIPTVDVGVAQLAMHSIREMCGVDDVDSAYKLLTLLMNNFPSIQARIQVDGE